MCEACPNCPECGQTVPVPAGLDYLAGLLAPPLVMLLAAIVAFHLEYIDTFLYGMLVGIAALGAVILVRTDPHPFRLKA